MNSELSSPPEILAEQFNTLRTRKDIAKLLDVTDYQLRYHLYILPPSKRYHTFPIAKASGGSRTIFAPNFSLKSMQYKLNQVFQAIYQPKAPVHGFVTQRSVVSNARQHVQRKYVLNLDLIDFFPSINFGRVRGMFLSVPYSCTDEVATVLAQICCHENQLPQGAPTSPIISNMLCSKLDSQLRKLAQAHRSTYTRYADDMTFSTSISTFPSALAKFSKQSGQLEIGIELQRIIRTNGFAINDSKVRLQTRDSRQEVTGIVVNRRVNLPRSYVRQLRAMLHAWDKYGLEAAAKIFIEKYDYKKRSPQNAEKLFKRVLKGKLDYFKMVRGSDDPLYLKYLRTFASLAPEMIKVISSNVILSQYRKPIVIYTEGKTDCQHLKAALQKLQEIGYVLETSIEFKEDLDESKQGSSQLLSICENACKTDLQHLIVAIFDRDEASVTKKIIDKSLPFKHWGKGVYSMPIPLPDHRIDTPEISIEFYYKDEEIQRPDDMGRRLYLSSEFNSKSGKHLDYQLINTDRHKIGKTIKIIDVDVFDEHSNNIALSKNAFAKNVYDSAKNFHDFDFSEFAKIFDMVQEISLHYVEHVESSNSLSE